MIIPLPAIPGVQSLDWNLERNVAVQQSPISNTVQRQVRSGDRWTATLNFPLYQREEAAVLEAFLRELSRGDRWLYLEPPQQAMRGNWPLPELIPNGTFMSGVQEWTARGGAQLIHNARRLKIRNGNAASGYAEVSQRGSTGPVLGFTRTTTARFTASDGLLRVAAINEPRFNYDPTTRVARGLLIEDARTNLLLQSQNFADAVWAKSSASIVANALISPDGSTNASKLVEAASSGGHFIQQVITKSASATTYHYSIFARAGERGWMQFTAYDGATNGVRSWFNLSAGTAGSIVGINTAFTNLSAAIQPIGNGYYRCTLRFTTSTDTTLYLNVYPAPDNLVDAYAGDGVSGIFIYGSQLEQEPLAGSTSSSYIPTNTTTVARTPDGTTIAQGSIVGATPSTAGSMLVEYVPSARGLSALCEFNDGSLSNQVRINQDDLASAKLVIRVGGAIILNQSTANTITSGALNRAACAWNSTSASVVLNGGSVATAAVSALPTATNTFDIGRGDAGAFYANSDIASVAIYGVKLSDSDLQTLSSGGVIAQQPVAYWDFRLGQLGHAGVSTEAGKPHVFQSDFRRGRATLGRIKLLDNAQVVEVTSDLTADGRSVLLWTPTDWASNVWLHCNTAALGDDVHYSGVSLARCLLVSGAGQVGARLNVSGGPTSMDAALRAGQFVCVQVGSLYQLLQLTEDLDTDGNGNGTLVFEPALRGSPANGAAVIVHRPFARFMLAAHSAPAAISAPNLHGFSVQVIEDITP